METTINTHHDLKHYVDCDPLPLSLVAASAGDRPLTEWERAFLNQLRRKRGKRLFSDFLFAVTHRRYHVETAEPLWSAVLKHKKRLSRTLNRNVRLVAATLDYLASVGEVCEESTLVAESALSRMSKLALRDILTGALNRTAFHIHLDEQMRMYERDRLPFSLIMLDLDEFKAVNDSFGHTEGDKVLRRTAASISGAIRASDICARYGGEEFAILLPGTGTATARAVAERIRSCLAARFIRMRNLTASEGVASCPTHARTIAGLLKASDAALYAAKRNGRNRVETYRPLMRRLLTARRGPPSPDVRPAA